MAENQAESYELISTATVTTTSDPLLLGTDSKTFQAKGTTTAGAGAATIIIEVTNDTTWPWITLGTITLTLGTAATSDGLAMLAGWKYVRARLSAISGTGAAVSVAVGI
jgi:hypothetical protein